MKKQPIPRTPDSGTSAAGGMEERPEGLKENRAQGEEAVHEDEVLSRIACGIRCIPDLDPPSDLLPSVMAAIRVKKRPWWYRAYRWATAPRSLTFTPLQAAPLAAALLAVCVISTLHLYTGREKGQFADSRSSDLTPVVLSLKVPEARSVAVIGSFNNWHPQECELHRNNGDTTWKATVWLPSGRYEYAFLVDGGKIVPDPHAAFYQDDGFGNQNTVLVVGNRDENAV